MNDKIYQNTNFDQWLFSWNKWRLYHSIIEKETLGLSQFSPFTDFLREREKMFYTYSRPMKFVEYEFQAVFPIIFSMDLLHTPFCLHVLHQIGETIFVLLFNFAPHFLCWILGVVPFNTRGGNLQNDIYFTQNGRSCQKKLETKGLTLPKRHFLDFSWVFYPK